MIPIRNHVKNFHKNKIHTSITDQILENKLEKGNRLKGEQYLLASIYGNQNGFRVGMSKFKFGAISRTNMINFGDSLCDSLIS